MRAMRKSVVADCCRWSPTREQPGPCAGLEWRGTLRLDHDLHSSAGASGPPKFCNFGFLRLTQRHCVHDNMGTAFSFSPRYHFRRNVFSEFCGTVVCYRRFTTRYPLTAMLKLWPECEVVETNQAFIMEQRRISVRRGGGRHWIFRNGVALATKTPKECLVSD